MQGRMVDNESNEKQAELRTIILDKIYAKGPIALIFQKRRALLLLQLVRLQEVWSKKTAVWAGGRWRTHKSRAKEILLYKKQHSYFIGCELSEKYFSFVLSDNTGNVIDKDKATVTSENSSRRRWFVCHLLLNTIFRTIPIQFKLKGVAIPGRYFAQCTWLQQTIKHGNNFDEGRLKTSFLPIYFSNVNCMALAKRLFSAYQLDENFIYFHFARGMHCSLYVQW